MSRSTKHAYEVTAIWGEHDGNVAIGGHLIDHGHVRKYHEPSRRWDFLNPDGSITSFVGKHIGEYEKVKHLLQNSGGGS